MKEWGECMFNKLNLCILMGGLFSMQHAVAAVRTVQFSGSDFIAYPYSIRTNVSRCQIVVTNNGTTSQWVYKYSIREKSTRNGVTTDPSTANNDAICSITRAGAPQSSCGSGGGMYNADYQILAPGESYISIYFVKHPLTGVSSCTGSIKVQDADPKTPGSVVASANLLTDFSVTPSSSTPSVPSGSSVPNLNLRLKCSFESPLNKFYKESLVGAAPNLMYLGGTGSINGLYEYNANQFANGPNRNLNGYFNDEGCFTGNGTRNARSPRGPWGFNLMTCNGGDPALETIYQGNFNRLVGALSARKYALLAYTLNTLQNNEGYVRCIHETASGASPTSAETAALNKNTFCKRSIELQTDNSQTNMELKKDGNDLRKEIITCSSLPSVLREDDNPFIYVLDTKKNVSFSNYAKFPRCYFSYNNNVMGLLSTDVVTCDYTLTSAQRSTLSASASSPSTAPSETLSSKSFTINNGQPF